MIDAGTNLITKLLQVIFFVCAMGLPSISTTQAKTVTVSSTKLSTQEIDQLSRLKLPQYKVKLKPQNINVSDSQGFTLLMSAVLNGREDLVKYLINNKANLEAKHSEGETALGFAIANDQIKIAKILLAAGANPVGIHAGPEKEPYFTRAVNSDLEFAGLMLQKNSKLVDSTDAAQETALMKVARDGSFKQALWLLKNQANKNLKNKKNQTALQIAVENKQFEIAELLKQN